MIELRDYQSEAVSKIRQSMASGNRKVIYHAATGSGKTATSSDIATRACSLGKKVLFLANRRELIHQAENTLSEFGLDCGIIMAGVEPNLSANIQIASMQTYIRRMDLDELRFNKWWHEADLIITDECHSSISPSFQKILKNYDTSFVLGLTATPCRGDGRGLGEFYDDIISTIDISKLIEQEYLVPVRYFAPHTPNLEGLKTVAGDYEKKELGKRVNTVKLVGDIYDNWSIICPERPTIIFATNVAHSIFIKETFLKHGVAIEHVDAKTPTEERKLALDDLKKGRLQVITNVGILCEGFDFPAASCICLARPTKSLGLYIQMGGRGLRPSEGKSDCIVLDFSGCMENHGKLEWDREWSLDGKEKAWSKKKEKEPVEKSLFKCRACHAVFTGEKTCPDCGTELKRFGKKVVTEDGELKEVNKKVTIAEKRIYLGMLKRWVCSKGYNPKMVTAKYKSKYGVWPHHSIKDVAQIEPDTAFLNLMRHDQIRWAKRENR